MEFIETFGLNPILLLAQVVNFLILFYLLKRLLYKPVLGIIKKREEKIKEGLDAARAGHELLEKAQEEERKIVTKASEEARSLVDEAVSRATKVEESIIHDAQKEKDTLIHRAQEQLIREKEAVERELGKKTVYEAINILERILPKVLSKQDQVRILKGSERLLEKVLVR